MINDNFYDCISIVFKLFIYYFNIALLFFLISIYPIKSYVEK